MSNVVRLSQVTYIYYQQQGRQPESIVKRHSKTLIIAEQENVQHYSREYSITDKWKPIDTGWLGENVSMVCIENLEGSDLVTTPTEEEKEHLARKVVHIRWANQPEELSMLLLPGAIQTLYPSKVKHLGLQAANGEGPIRIKVSVFPNN